METTSKDLLHRLANLKSASSIAKRLSACPHASAEQHKRARERLQKIESEINDTIALLSLRGVDPEPRQPPYRSGFPFQRSNRPHVSW